MATVSKPTPSEAANADLYERDYYQWIETQVHALRDKRVEELDWANLAEEVEDLGRSQKHSVESQIARIIEHFLKLAYSPTQTINRSRRGWELSIREARHQIRKLFGESPSLRRKTSDLYDDAYETGRTSALTGLNLPDSALPETSPWTLEQVLDDGFLPDGSGK
jgi:hypothetical protein